MSERDLRRIEVLSKVVIVECLFLSGRERTSVRHFSKDLLKPYAGMAKRKIGYSPEFLVAISTVKVRSLKAERIDVGTDALPASRRILRLCQQLHSNALTTRSGRHP